MPLTSDAAFGFWPESPNLSEPRVVLRRWMIYTLHGAGITATNTLDLNSYLQLILSLCHKTPWTRSPKNRHHLNSRNNGRKFHEQKGNDEVLAGSLLKESECQGKRVSDFNPRTCIEQSIALDPFAFVLLLHLAHQAGEHIKTNAKIYTCGHSNHKLWVWVVDS